MNAHDKIELPPLPAYETGFMSREAINTMRNYARAAVEADRKRRGVPVAWIRKNGFRFISEIEPQDDSEVPLYATPQPANPDYKQLFEQMCERYNALDAKLAEYSERKPVAWQFYDDGRWWNGDDRIKDHRKNTENAGYKTRDLYAAPQPAELATQACNLQPTKLVTISEIIPSDYSEPVKVPSDEDIIQLFVDMVQKDEIGGPVMDISMKEAIEVSRELLRRYGNTANPRPTDDELLGQALRERDAASEMADKLANAIAKHLGVEIGEHTSSNHPWYRALDAIEIAQHAEPVAWISRETLLGMHKDPQMNIVLNRVYLRCSQVYEDEVPLFLGPQPADHFADVRKMLPSDAEIREVFLANGFTIKPGLDDLKPYVYEAARDLLSRYGNAVQTNKETP